MKDVFFKISNFSVLTENWDFPSEDYGQSYADGIEGGIAGRVSLPLGSNFSGTMDLSTHLKRCTASLWLINTLGWMQKLYGIWKGSISLTQRPLLISGSLELSDVYTDFLIF